MAYAGRLSLILSLSLTIVIATFLIKISKRKENQMIYYNEPLCTQVVSFYEKKRLGDRHIVVSQELYEFLKEEFESTGIMIIPPSTTQRGYSVHLKT
jgi:hypothetical protein